MFFNSPLPLMPTKSKAKSKIKTKKITAKAKSRAKIIKHAVKKATIKRVAQKMKKNVTAKLVKKKTPAIKVLGRVTHFYDKISVAIVELTSPVMLGDRVSFNRGTHELTQKITSLQIEHEPIKKAKKGDVIGMKVKKEVQSGTLMTRA